MDGVNGRLTEEKALYRIHASGAPLPMLCHQLACCCYLLYSGRYVVFVHTHQQVLQPHRRCLVLPGGNRRLFCYPLLQRLRNSP